MRMQLQLRALIPFDVELSTYKFCVNEPTFRLYGHCNMANFNFEKKNDKINYMV